METQARQAVPLPCRLLLVIRPAEGKCPTQAVVQPAGVAISGRGHLQGKNGNRPRVDYEGSVTRWEPCKFG